LPCGRGKEAALGLGAGEGRTRLDESPEARGAAVPGVAGDEGEELSAPDEMPGVRLGARSLEVARRRCREIEKRAGRGGERDAVASADFVRRKPLGAMQTDAGPASGVAPADGDVDRA
jgi:hypothetical protein